MLLFSSLLSSLHAVGIRASSHQAIEFSQRTFRGDKKSGFCFSHDAFGKRDIAIVKTIGCIADYLRVGSVRVTLTQSLQPDTLLHLLSTMQSKLFGSMLA